MLVNERVETAPRGGGDVSLVAVGGSELLIATLGLRAPGLLPTPPPVGL